jgi:hypothetical protein
MDSLLRSLERLHDADPTNVDIAQHLIATYRRSGLGTEDFRSTPKIRKMKGEIVEGVEVTDDEVDVWIDGFLSSLRSDSEEIIPYAWTKLKDTANAEYRVASIMSGDTLLQGLAWCYLGTDTWYISFDVAKRHKRYYGQRTFNAQPV